MSEYGKPTISHLSLASLRGQGYVFERELPDVTDEKARHAYMDSFLRYILPISNKFIATYRTTITVKYLRLLVEKRYRWVASDWLSCMIDFHVWMSMCEYLPSVPPCYK